MIEASADCGHILFGAGEMAARIADFDWARTPLGPIESWPQSLKTSLSLILGSTHPMWIGWGSQMTFFYNDAYLHVLGPAKHPHALGRPAAEIWAEIWDVCGPLANRVFDSGQATFMDDVRLFMNRGDFVEETFYSFSYSPIRDESGAVAGLFCPSTDVTAKVLNTRRLRTLSELAANSLIEKTTSRACLTAAQILAKNPDDVPFAILYLADPDEKSARLEQAVGIAGMTFPAIVDLNAESDIPPPWPITAVFRTGQRQIVSTEYVAAVPASVGGRRVADAVVLPVASRGEHRPYGVLLAGVNPCRPLDADHLTFFELIAGQVATAIQNARVVEEEKKRADMLAEIDRAKTVFFSNVSHEFRTPLTLMLGPLENVLDNGEIQPRAREQLALAYRNSLRLQKLVNSLLEFSRLEGGRLEALFSATDLSAFTAAIASNFRSAMEAAGLKFIVDCEPMRDPVYVDREMWEKVVLNLISNAFKYTLTGAVTVKISASGDHARFSVEDTGLGIPGHEIPRLFERFHRVEGAAGRTMEGTGIGLALVQEVVRLHGGSIQVESVLAKGSTFTVQIPFGSAHLPPEYVREAKVRVPTATHADAYVEEALRWLGTEDGSVDSASDRETGIAGIARGRILVADDNADMRDYIRRILEPRYEVTAVSNGEEALRAALAHRPDLVVSDVMMPAMDGFELLQQLRSEPRTRILPVILLSARAGEESRVEGLQAGADDYLTKPFSARELAARVDAHLSLVRMRREADDARRLSEVRLGLALETTNTVAWEWDPASDEVSATADLSRIFGAPVRNPQDALALLHPEDALRERLMLNPVPDRGSWVAEFRVIRPDTGQTVWAEGRATAVTDDTGQVVRVAGVLMDITARKAAEDELRHRNIELERANSELEEFAYVASHDLQEPLRTINIFTELFLARVTRQEDVQAREFAGFISGSVRRMERLIQDLLAYARVVHREQEPAGAVSLEASLGGALENLRGAVEQSGAVITCHLRDASVIADREQISGVFQNLISNSLKYRRQDVIPRIRVEARVQRNEWLVTVSDNGIGFSPEYAERIFGLFKRLQNKYPGTGLGLAICRRIIERYDGRIWATSEGEGKGSSFHFTLPAHRV